MPDINVLFATYGAITSSPDSDDTSTAIFCAAAVKNLIEEALEEGGDRALIKIDNDTIGFDPAVGNTKHFAMAVEIDGKLQYAACEEGQELLVLADPDYSVQFAVYGALPHNGGESEAVDCTSIVQSMIDGQRSSNATDLYITVSNTALGGDPAPGHDKHFAMSIEIGDEVYNVACEEDQDVLIAGT